MFSQKMISRFISEYFCNDKKNNKVEFDLTITEKKRITERLFSTLELDLNVSSFRFTTEEKKGWND